jgi:hypothetical protein
VVIVPALDTVSRLAAVGAAPGPNLRWQPPLLLVVMIVILVLTSLVDGVWSPDDAPPRDSGQIETSDDREDL